MNNLQILPKLELHAHLNGSLSVETLRELGKLKGNEAFTSEWPQWEEALKDLSSCFELFRIAHNLTQAKEAISLATLRTIQEFEADGIIYLELRSTPRVLKDGGKKDYLQALIDGVINAKTQKIITTVIVSVNRSESLAMAQENVKLAIEFHAKYPEIVVGVDFSGDPSKGNFLDFAQTLNEVRPKLKVTIHFAEIQNDKEVTDILMFGADRLGHGTFLSHGNLEILQQMKTPVELCVTSNVKCGTVIGVDAHHFKKLREIQHPVVLSTDDKGVFNTTLSREYELAQQHFNLTTEDSWQMNFHAVEYIFASETVKEKLRQQLQQWKVDNS